MEILYAILFIVIIGGVIAILYIYQYNKLQHSKTKIDQAEYLIDESLRKKYDLLIEAEEHAKKELKVEKGFFKGIEKIKKDAISNFDLDRKLQEYENILNQLKADYAVLEDSKEFRKLLSEMKKVEEKLQAAKSFYNKYTSELNDLIRLFPSNVVAKMHGISIKPFFDGKNMQDEIFDDFKL